MKITSALAGGLAGSIVLTALHQILRATNRNAPHMDELGMEAIAKGLNKADVEVPEEKKLYLITMAGDIVSNAAYYSLIGLSSKNSIWVTGTILGLAAGIGGVTLPRPMGLNEEASARTNETKVLTVGLYLTGALVATAVINAVNKDE